MFDLWARLFGRPRFARVNRMLYMLGLRGLGILNHRSMRESGELLFLQKLLAAYGESGRAQPVVLDVGANVGKYASEILAIRKDTRIYCFEPHPANVARLMQSIGPRATVVPCAVGADEGTLDLFDYEGSDGSSHASVYKEVFEHIHRQAHVSHRVDVVAIDAFLEREQIDHVALLKIDTEGHELAALAGASRSLSRCCIDVVHFEFNEMNIVPRVFIADFFKALPGFRLYRLLPHGWLQIPENRPLENIFAFQNIVAIREGSRPHAVLT